MYTGGKRAVMRNLQGLQAALSLVEEEEANQDLKWVLLQSHCVEQGNLSLNGCLLVCAKVHLWQVSDHAATSRQRKQAKC